MDLNTPTNFTNLAIASNYFNRYFLLLPFHKNGNNAFQALEAEYFAMFKRNKYKNYETFRASKSIFYNKNF